MDPGRVVLLASVGHLSAGSKVDVHIQFDIIEEMCHTFMTFVHKLDAGTWLNETIPVRYFITTHL